MGTIIDNPRHPRLFCKRSERVVTQSSFNHEHPREAEVFITTSELTSNDVIVNSCEIRTTDIVEELDNYKLSDFSISNLQAVGAKLNPVYVTPNNIDTVDKATSFVSGLDVEINDNDKNDNK